MPCLFCKDGVFYYNMPRHLARQHSDRPEVAYALAKAKKERTLAMKKITNEGIFRHNSEVLRTQTGQFIPARSPRQERVISDYRPCPYCLLSVVKEELWRHCASCPFRQPKVGGHHDEAEGHKKRKSVIDSSEAILDSVRTEEASVKVDPALRDKVMDRMRNDRTKSQIRRDNLILRYGSLQLHKLGPRRHNDISARMRMLGNLRLRLQSLLQKDNYQLDDVITGEGFDKIIEAIECEGQAFIDESGRWGYKKPSLALKLGYIIKKLAYVKQGQAVRNEDTKAKQDAEIFITLHNSEFTDRVATPALASLRKMENTLNQLPADKDLNNLRNYMVTRMKELCKLLSACSNVVLWRELVEVTASRVIVFNARRGGEVATLLVVDYTCRSQYDIKEIEMEEMDDLEKMLARRW